MLCFVQTDAALTPETADLLLGVCVKRSFDRISVDGQLSTNDTVILQASGASGVAIAPQSEDEVRFGEALDWALRKLALRHRPRRRGRQADRARGRARRLERRSSRAPRAVANSPLVKAALHGGDPNWGRIAQAVGAALPGTAPLALDIFIEDVQVCAAAPSRLRRRGAGRGGRRRGGRVRRRRCPATAPRPRSSSPTSRTST